MGAHMSEHGGTRTLKGSWGSEGRDNSWARMDKHKVETLQLYEVKHSRREGM